MSYMFSIGAIAAVRQMLAEKRPMASICHAMRWLCDRDELVEAIDACHRHQNNHDAQRHVNHVLALQASGVPLINGKPADDVLRRRPVAMF